MFEPRNKRSNVPGALLAGAIVTFFCLILYWHDPLVFFNDDYQLSILPVFADVARSWSEGHLPLLSPYSWVCSNLAGEFQYGTFSVFVNAAVVLIWKFPLTFPQQAAALSITHLVVLAMGAFVLARGRAFSFALSIFVSLVATLNGWIICWGATDWFGALGAFAWLPWAWCALEKSLICSGQPAPVGGPTAHSAVATVKAAIWPAPFVYLVITGGFPYTVVMLALLIGWLSAKSLVQTKRLSSILPMLAGVALGIGLAAPAWLALFDYVHGSARQAQPASAHWQWIVPWRALPAFILPCWTVDWADFSTRLVPHGGAELACGLAAPIAVAAALVNRGRAFVRQILWELILLVSLLLLCMVPTTGLFRWSFRWLPFFHLVLALCAARALADDRRSRPIVALLLAGGCSVAMFVFHTAGDRAFPLVWILIALTGLWALWDSFLRNEQLREWIPAFVTFAAFLATYLCIPPNCGVPKYNLSQELTKPSPLDVGRLYLSIYPPPEWNYRFEMRRNPIGQIVRPGSTSMWAGLRFINGYSPIRPAGVARELKADIHGEIDLAIGHYLMVDQSGALAELGVDGLVVAPEIGGAPPLAEWQLVSSYEEGRVYHRLDRPFETVRSVSWSDSQPDRQFALAKISGIDDSRNSVSADIDVPPGEQPALIKFTRPNFPGYKARLDNTRLPVSSYRGLVPTVEVPAGSHGRLVLVYQPAWLIYGGGLAVVCAAAMIFAGAWAVRLRG